MNKYTYTRREQLPVTIAGDVGDMFWFLVSCEGEIADNDDELGVFNWDWNFTALEMLIGNDDD